MSSVWGGAGEADSAQTLRNGSSSVASWQNEAIGDGGSPLQEGQLSSDALNTAAYSLAVGEVAPEDVEVVEKNGKKQLLGRGSYGEVNVENNKLIIAGSSAVFLGFVLVCCIKRHVHLDLILDVLRRLLCSVCRFRLGV